MITLVVNGPVKAAHAALHPVSLHCITHIRLTLTGWRARATPGVSAPGAEYADQMSGTRGFQGAGGVSGPLTLRIRVLMPVSLLVVALASSCLPSGSAVSAERAEVLDDVVERWIAEVEGLRSVLEGVKDADSSIRSVSDVRSRVNLMRSIMLEAGERSDEDEAYVKTAHGKRLDRVTISLDAERRRLGIDGRIGTEIPDMLVVFPHFGGS